jgi:hypothetical protein
MHEPSVGATASADEAGRSTPSAVTKAHGQDSRAHTPLGRRHLSPRAPVRPSERDRADRHRRVTVQNCLSSQTERQRGEMGRDKELASEIAVVAGSFAVVAIVAIVGIPSNDNVPEQPATNALTQMDPPASARHPLPMHLEALDASSGPPSDVAPPVGLRPAPARVPLVDSASTSADTFARSSTALMDVPSGTGMPPSAGSSPSGTASSEPTPGVTPSPTATATPSASPTATPSPTVSPTVPPEETTTSTPTPTGSSTPSEEPSPT